MGSYKLQRHEVRHLGRDGLLAGGDPEVVQPGQSEDLGTLPDGRYVPKVDLLRGNGDNSLAMVTTVALTLERIAPPTLAQANETFPVYARVLFGVGGTTALAEVDFVNGSFFSIPTASIMLSAIVDVPQLEAPFAVRAGAFLAYLPVADVRPPQRTLRATLAAAGVVTFPVPAFGQELTLLGSALGATFVLEQLRDAAGAVVISAEAIPAVPPHITAPLANDTRYVRITNTGPATDVRAIFGLAL